MSDGGARGWRFSQYQNAGSRKADDAGGLFGPLLLFVASLLFGGIWRASGAFEVVEMCELGSGLGVAWLSHLFSFKLSGCDLPRIVALDLVIPNSIHHY